MPLPHQRLRDKLRMIISSEPLNVAVEQITTLVVTREASRRPADTGLVFDHTELQNAWK